jgi:hypothetical protein
MHVRGINIKYLKHSKIYTTYITRNEKIKYMLYTGSKKLPRARGPTTRLMLAA